MTQGGDGGHDIAQTAHSPACCKAMHCACRITIWFRVSACRMMSGRVCGHIQCSLASACRVMAQDRPDIIVD